MDNDFYSIGGQLVLHKQKIKDFRKMKENNTSNIKFDKSFLKDETEGVFAVIGCLCIPYIVISVGIMLLCFYGCQEKPYVKGEDKIGAYTMAEHFVKKKLKSPKTAEFAGYSSSTVFHNGDGVYTVRSYVDSENSFGATIRTKFTAKVRENGDETWSLLSLEFHDNF